MKQLVTLDSRWIEYKLSLGLAVFADSYPEMILERLLKDFQHGPSLPTSKKKHSLETRLKVGEVLMRASRAMGEHHLQFFQHEPLIQVYSCMFLFNQENKRKNISAKRACEMEQTWTHVPAKTTGLYYQTIVYNVVF